MGSPGKNQRSVARTRKMRARNYHFIRIFLVVILACATFVLGFYVRGNTTFLASLGFPESITGISQGDVVDANASKKDVFNSLSARVSEVEDILADDSLDTYSLEEVTDSALNAFAEACNDPYLRYYSQSRYASLNVQNDGYAGIGVLFSEHNGQAYAVDVFEGSPAQLSGVEEGDYIVSINGDNSQTWSRSEVSAVLSQAQGTNVVITWRRPESLEADGGREFTTTLGSQEYDEKNVTREYNTERKVGYIKVKQFTQNAAELTEKAIKKLADEGAGAFVLDLRDNPGGYLSQAIDLASLFMRSGTVVEVQTKDGVSAKASSGKPATDRPLVIITNKNTAAAAEVVVAACKESQRADAVVGTTTLGKGSVQALHDLTFGGALRYTAAYYLTPEGHAIDKVGVAPTITLEASGEGDSQKDYAIELAGSLVTAE